MNKLPSYNLNPTASAELKMMFLVPLLDRGFETSLFGCGCGKLNGCGSGDDCQCGSQNGGGGGSCGQENES